MMMGSHRSYPMVSIKQKILLSKISLALLVLDGCVLEKLYAASIEYKPRMFQHHYVNPGETLDGIAKFYGMTKKELSFINQLRPGYPLTKGRRLHVHRRKFLHRKSLEERFLSKRISKDLDNLDVYDPEDAGPNVGRMPRTTHVIVKRLGLFPKLCSPFIAAGGALAALRPRMAFAGGLGAESPDTKDYTIRTGGKRKPQASNFNQTFEGDGGENFDAPPIVTRNEFLGQKNGGGFLKSTALPLLGLATGGAGFGAALISTALGSKKKGIATTTGKSYQNCCGTRPCFTWPVNNEDRKFIVDKKNNRIKILNTRNERYVRPANSGIIEKIITPHNTGNLNMYTVVISHDTSQCRSTYKTVYSGLVKVPNTLHVGREVNRDMVIGEIKPCCQDSGLFFQILDSDVPVKSTKRYLPSI